MTLNDYLTYNEDVRIEDVFEPLYRDLEIINKNGLAVNKVDSNHIVYNEKTDKFEFEDDFYLADSATIEKNLVDFTKVFFGAYFTMQTGFKDFIEANLEWIKDNFDEIANTIVADSFDKDYFERVFDGEIIYYNNYRNQKTNDGASRSNGRKYQKALFTGYDEENENRERAYINKMLIPALLLSLLVVSLVIIEIFVK